MRADGQLELNDIRPQVIREDMAARQRLLGDRARLAHWGRLYEALVEGLNDPDLPRDHQAQLRGLLGPVAQLAQRSPLVREPSGRSAQAVG